jgi:hypothetical protein
MAEDKNKRLQQVASHGVSDMMLKQCDGVPSW